MIALLVTFAYMFAFSYLALRFACAAPPKKVDKGQTPPHRLRPSEDTAPMSIMFTSDTIEKVRAEAHATGRELRPGDVAIAINLQHGRFSTYNKALFAEQIRMWQKHDIHLLEGNIKAIDFPEIKDAVLFTVQPRSGSVNVPICPLALAFDKMVTGLSFITNRAIAEYTWRKLGSAGSRRTSAGRSGGK